MKTFFAVATLIVCVPGAVAAQGANAQAQAEAQALFDQGRKLMDAGNYAEACPKLEASQKLDPGAGTLLNLAACYEKNGQIASAWVTFTDAATASSASGHPEWVERARSHIAALQPRLTKLTITVKAKADGLVVKRDGKIVSSAVFDAPIPVDPGTHLVEASAPGKLDWRGKAEATTKGGDVVITVPPLVDAPTDGAQPSTAPTRGGGRGDGQRALGLVVAGAGVIGLAIGAGFGVDAASKKGIVDDARYCIRVSAPGAPIHCNQQGYDQITSAQTSATVSTVLLAAGAALVVGGGILFFTAPKGAPAAGLRVVPAAPSSLAGLSVEGAF